MHINNIITDNEKLYVSIREIGLVAMDIETGEIEWKYDIQGINEATLSSELILFMNDRGVLHACNRKTGELAWKSIVSCNSSTPVVYHNLILFPGIFAYDNSGKKLWEWPTGADYFKLIPINSGALLYKAPRPGRWGFVAYCMALSCHIKKSCSS